MYNKAYDYTLMKELLKEDIDIAESIGDYTKSNAYNDLINIINNAIAKREYNTRYNSAVRKRRKESK